MSQQKIY